jgi:hypothetical protein
MPLLGAGGSDFPILPLSVAGANNRHHPDRWQNLFQVAGPEAEFSLADVNILTLGG